MYFFMRNKELHSEKTFAAFVKETFIFFI